MPETVQLQSPTTDPNNDVQASTGTKGTAGTDDTAVSTMTTATHSPVGTGVRTGVRTGTYKDDNEGSTGVNKISLGFSVTANSISFGDTNTPETWHCVPVQYTLSPLLWDALSVSDMFRNWLTLYADRPSVVRGVDVKACGDDNCEWAVIVPQIEIADSVSTQDKILLQQPSTVSVPAVGILVILRCANNTGQQSHYDTSISTGSNQSSSNSWMRDIVLFSVVHRPAVGTQSRLEILKGKFDENNEFSSPQADDLDNVLGIRIHKDDLFPMTQTEVAPAPACLSQTLDLYLYRRNITAAQLTALQSSVGSSANRLAIAVMGEAWRMTSDATSMAALFLFHEYRYYRLMPRYQPPRDAVAMDTTVKLKPQFTTVAAIDPRLQSVNLKVRIVHPRQPAETHQPDEGEGASRRAKDAFCVVGDSTGTVKLRLVGGQVEYPESLTEAGTHITLRNAVVSVVEGKLLVTVNKWGKLLVVDDPIEVQSDFNFEVQTANDMSAIEYELVPTGHAPRNDDYHPQANNRGQQRYRGMRNVRGDRGNRR